MVENFILKDWWLRIVKVAWFAGDWLVIVVNERNERLALRKKD
jgi:hypothetical protein